MATKQIVKELVTRWTYKVDSSQVKTAVKAVQGLKKTIIDVRSDSAKFAQTEIKKVRRIKAAWQSLNKSVRNYRTELTKSQKKEQTVGMLGGGMAGGFKSFAAMRALGIGSTMAAGMAAGTGIAALTAGVGAVRAGMGEELALIEYEGFLKSADKAKAKLKELADFGRKTPFEIPQLEQYGAQLLAGGFAAEQLIPNLRRLGNLTGANADKMQRMIINLIQIRTQQKAYTQDIKQFAMANIPIYEALQKTTGRSAAEIREMLKQGKITFPLVQKALRSLTEDGGLFEGRMARMSQTLELRLSNLKDSFFFLGRELTRGLVPKLGNVAEMFSNLTDMVADGVAKVNEFKHAWTGLAVAAGIALTAFKPWLAFLAGILIIVEDIYGFAKDEDSLIGSMSRALPEATRKMSPSPSDNPFVGGLGGGIGIPFYKPDPRFVEPSGNFNYESNFNIEMNNGESASRMVEELEKFSKRSERNAARRFQHMQGN